LEKRTPIYIFLQEIAQWVIRPFCPFHAQGMEQVPKEGAAIICCNHLGLTDVLRLGFSLKRQIYYMAKAELFRFKPFAAILRGLGAYPVQRGRGDMKAINESKRLIREGHLLGIFPEGHRSKDGLPGHPKAGAVMLSYKYQIPIVPCCIVMHGGGPVKLFHRAEVIFGAPIKPQELQITKGKGSEYRAANHLVWEKILKIREETLKKFS
jgi:1-acyl-sn-glycerol-3-phosphate acyltransferase